jgi:hypothetical protein
MLVYVKMYLEITNDRNYLLISFKLIIEIYYVIKIRTIDYITPEL